ncbi:hypothetical protein ACFFX0_06900 [Citricoccus parietis]|uniref:Uncharacterized protein n=1 Tax=Citricoccus parietis TaxID=592307 RepID=A0ABV5FXH2_9MICC
MRPTLASDTVTWDAEPSLAVRAAQTTSRGSIAAPTARLASAHAANRAAANTRPAVRRKVTRPRGRPRCAGPRQGGP